jgi:SAM-dependent methyltransferase
MPSLPWFAKMVLKIVLSRLPICYGIWKKIGIFRHGRMDDPDYALRIFNDHLKAFTGGRAAAIVLELGPGDSLATALVAYSRGFAGSILVDAGDFATHDFSSYQRIIDYLTLHTGDRKIPDVSESTDELLKAVKAQYFTAGLRSLQQIPADSVDFIFSNSALQHIKREEFVQEVRELHRILKGGGICSHRVDLKDMLGGSLNHLRFTTSIWESSLWASSGFYTNRLRCFEMSRIFENGGFEIVSLTERKWDTLPISRQRLAPEFSVMSDDELCIQGFDVVLKKSCHGE